MVAFAALALVPLPLWAGQSEIAANEMVVANAGPPNAYLPDVPDPQTLSSSPTPKPTPCLRPGIQEVENLPADDPEKGAAPPAEPGVHPAVAPCTSRPLNWYQRFTNGPKDKPLTGRDKGWLAARNLVDPFNMITIGGEAAFSVGFDSHSPYGPGMPGYARYVGVSLTQDMTGEFFGTFLIPALTHQDPHYHRMEGARISRRAWHAIAQVFWTEGDSGKMMPNYANLAGFAVEDEISNLYVPGRKTNAGAIAERYATGLATAPIGNFVNEFLPDVASHIHVQIVILQRIINQVAQKETINSTGSSGGGE